MTSSSSTRASAECFRLAPLVLALSACSGIPRTEPPPVAWVKTYARGSRSYFGCVRETRDGGFILAGWSLQGEKWDYYLVRTDPGGEQLWSRVFGTELDERARFVEETRDGGFIVASDVNEAADCCLIRIAPDGTELWRRTYGGPGSEEAWGVRETADGGFVLAGWTSSFGAGKTDVYLLKTDAFGGQLWQRTFGGEGWEGFSHGELQSTADGGFIIATSTTSASLGARHQDVYLIRTDGNGERYWENTLGGEGTETGTSVEALADGGFIVAGRTGNQMYLARTDAGGMLIWEGTYGRAVDDGACVRAMDARGFVAVTRTSDATADHRTDIYLVGVDAEGKASWDLKLPRDGYDSASSIEVLRAGGFAVAGSFGDDALLARFGSGPQPGRRDLPLGVPRTTR